MPSSVEQVESGTAFPGEVYQAEMAYGEDNQRLWRRMIDPVTGNSRIEATIPGVAAYVKENDGAWRLSRLELVEGGYRTDGTGAALFAVTDVQGNVRGYAKRDGGLASAYGYYPYGMVHELKEDNTADRSRWQGKEWDGEYGKYYFGSRYFDPYFGLWISPDPAGQFSNPYTYGGDPVNFVDPYGLWSIGLGLTFGWDSKRGFNVGLGAAMEFGDNNYGTNFSYSWHQDGTRSFNAGGKGGVNIYGFNLYAGGGYSWNSVGGSELSLYTGANYMGFVGGETGGSLYFDNDWNYLGATVRQEFYAGYGPARAYGGYEWGFGGMQGRGWYGGAEALGLNAGYAQNGGWSYGAGTTINLYQQSSLTLNADGYIDQNDWKLNAFAKSIDNGENEYNFVAHGSQYEIGLLNGLGKLNADDFTEKLLNQEFRYNLEENIILHSCMTGHGTNNFAKQLSANLNQRLDGKISVTAPTDRIRFTAHRMLFFTWVSNVHIVNGGQWVTY